MHNTISMIAAIGMNRELGEGNKLIWHISDDLKRFKELTMGHPVIVGRKTFESILLLIGKPLPGRTNIIVTRDPSYQSEGVTTVHSFDEALETAKSAPGSDEIFIIGGAQIFEEAIKLADRLYLTKINSMAPMADVFFPDYSDFKKTVFSEKHEEDSLQYEFVNLER